MTSQTTPPPGPGSQAPPGHNPNDPPPLTALAWRHRLSRPKQGRMLAGVCAGAARATNTDVVVWRVLAAVLSLFFVGILVYIIAWLIMPADGDTATPVESVLGRGQSSSSRVLIFTGIIIVLACIAGGLGNPWGANGFYSTVVIGLLAAVGVLLLLLVRDQRGGAAGGGAAGPRGTAPPMSSVAHAPGGAQASPHGTQTPPYGTQASPYGDQASPYGTQTPPYGTQTPPYGTQAPPPPYAAPVPPPLPAAPPVPAGPRSRLGLFTFSLTLIVLGVMALLDLAGAPIVGPAYPAAALATVGLGLLIGTWLGRARGLIALGILLSLALAATYGAERVYVDGSVGTRQWTPLTFAEVDDRYSLDAGDATLDLTDLDFSDLNRLEIEAHVGMGSLRIILPPTVDTEVSASVNIGNARVFDHRWNGVGQDTGTISDQGTDGPGGGYVHIVADVDLGNLEVSR